MAPLGIGTGFYGVGPAMGSDNAAAVVTPTGTAVRVIRGNDEGLYFEASVLKTTFRGSFTIAFWIKVVDGRPSSVEFLCGNLGDGATDHLALSVLSNGKILYLFTADSDQHNNQTNAAVFADGANAYKHIAVTMTKVSGGNSTSIIYVDGAAVTTSIQSSLEIAEANHETWDDGGDVFAIGALGTFITAVLGGTYTGLGTNADFAEFAIWEVVLDADAIAAVEDLGVPTGSNNPNLLVDDGNYDVSSNLVAYWKLNDYSGAVANESKSGFHGTLNGVSAFIP
jgi:hypothetical protein